MNVTGDITLTGTNRTITAPGDASTSSGSIKFTTPIYAADTGASYGAGGGTARILFTGGLGFYSGATLSAATQVVSISTTGTVTAAAFTANTGVFTGNGSGLTAIAGANVTGTVGNATNAAALLTTLTTTGTAFIPFISATANGNYAHLSNANFSANLANGAITATTFVGALSGAATSATTAGTVTTAAQPNITSVGSLSSLSSSGNISGVNIISTTNHVFSVATGITAAGTTQGTATAITKDFNVVATATAGTGVILPVIAGLRMTVINNGANPLAVYPGTSGAINALAANAAYTLAVGGKLDFLSVTTTQWYTLNATYA